LSTVIANKRGHLHHVHWWNFHQLNRPVLVHSVERVRGFFALVLKYVFGPTSIRANIHSSHVISSESHMRSAAHCGAAQPHFQLYAFKIASSDSSPRARYVWTMPPGTNLRTSFCFLFCFLFSVAMEA
jgi:hypothetical protein